MIDLVPRAINTPHNIMTVKPWVNRPVVKIQTIPVRPSPAIAAPKTMNTIEMKFRAVTAASYYTGK